MMKLSNWEKMALEIALENLLERNKIHQEQGKALLKKINDCENIELTFKN